MLYGGGLDLSGLRDSLESLPLRDWAVRLSKAFGSRRASLDAAPDELRSLAGRAAGRRVGREAAGSRIEGAAPTFDKSTSHRLGISSADLLSV